MRKKSLSTMTSTKLYVLFYGRIFLQEKVMSNTLLLEVIFPKHKEVAEFKHMTGSFPH